ncbi:MAG TPA: iron transporter [Acidimicrobiales bacterium]
MSDMPPMTPSNEADEEQLRVAAEAGTVYAKAVLAMAEETGVRLREAGDYVIGVAAEEAEGMYGLDGDGGLVWYEPEEANAHVEVTVADRADGRFVPGLEVTVEITGADGAPVGRHRMPFLWHPFLYHYGHNWKVPGEGDYLLDVHIEPARFFRHDPVNGRRYAEPVLVRFEGVHIEPGIKRSPDAEPRSAPAGPTAAS